VASQWKEELRGRGKRGRGFRVDTGTCGSFVLDLRLCQALYSRSIESPKWKRRYGVRKQGGVYFVLALRYAKGFYYIFTWSLFSSTYCPGQVAYPLGRL